MATASIKVKRSAVAGKIPATTDLDLGEIAINTYDGVAYIKKNVNGTETVVNLGGTVQLSQNLQNRYQYTATSNQTTFAATYLAPFVDVFLNGVKLLIGTEYTATNGTNIVLATGASAGSILDIIAYSTYTANANYADLSNSMVVNALGYTPYNATNPSNYITTAGARSAISVTGAGSYNSSTGVINIVGGVTSFNTRTGAISLTSGDVTGALGYTPYDSANPSNYITVAQARGSVSASGSLAYNSSTGVFSYTTPSTSGITEGSNLYYTDARARAAVSATGSLSYNSSTGVFSYTTPSTSGITEGSNLYYTDARARGAVSAGGSLSYNSSTGVFSYTTPTTSGIVEGSNLYYTDSRARAALSAGTGISYNSSTGAISSTITQYTDALARGAVSATGSLSYNSSTGVFSYTTPSTTGITEGTNLYYTDARARAAISVTGSGSYNSTTGVITVIGGVTSVNTRTGAVTLTSSDVGLGSVENKSSATIRGEITSSNVTTALGFTPENSANRGVANGYASLNSSGQIPSGQLPSYVDDVIEGTNLASFPATGETGKIYVALDTNKTYRWSGSAYVYITSGAVDSVAGKTGVVTLTNADVGLGSVENKSSSTIRSEITSSNVTTALGFTPYNATNPSSYITTAGARTAISASGSLSYNSTTGVISYTAPTAVSSFTNDSGYITSSALSGYLTSATAASTYLPLAGGTLSGASAQMLVIRNTGDYARLALDGASGSGGDLIFKSNGVAKFGIYNSGGGGDLGFYPNDGGTASVVMPNAGGLLIGGNTTLHAGNYTSYSPSLSGSGASGTWSINVTGSAGTAGSVDYANLTNKTGGTGTYTTSGDYRAPIFYDTNDTGYYGDFASTSVLSKLTLNGKQTAYNQGIPPTSGTSTPAIQRIYAGYGTWGEVLDTGINVATSYGWIQATNYSNLGINYPLFLNPNGGYVSAGSDFRAPIFYDSQDTSFYVNPNSISHISGIYIGSGNGVVNQTGVIKEAGTTYGLGLFTWADTAPIRIGGGSAIFQKESGGSVDVTVTGSLAINGPMGNSTTPPLVLSPSSSSGTFQWASTAISSSLGVGQTMIHILGNALSTGNSGYLGFNYAGGVSSGSNYVSLGLYGNDNLLRVYHGSFTEASGSMRAPIFYDSNNTGYYADPAGTSVLNAVNWYGVQNWAGDGAYAKGTPTYGFRFNNSADTINAFIVNNSGDTTSYSSSRAPIFYDSNNTGYYVDPASTSNLNSSTSNTVYSNYFCGLSGNGYGWYKGYDNNNHFITIRGAVSGTTTALTITGAHQTTFVEHMNPANTTCGWFFKDSYNGGNYNYPIVARIHRNESWFEGALYGDSSVRSPIFYDSNDTGYYADPNGNSILYYANFLAATGGSSSNGIPAIKIAGLSNYASLELGVQSNYDGFLRSYGNNLHYYAGHWRTAGSTASEDHQHYWYTSRNGSADWSTWKMQLNPNAALLVTGSIYSPIFYDYNDTGYYTDQNGTSNYNALTLAGTLRLPNNALINVNNEPDTWGARFRTSTSTTYLGSQLQNIIWCGGGANEGFTVQGVGTGGAAFSVRNDGTAWARASLRSPIFYDQDDTGYYLNPNGTSNLYTGIFNSAATFYSDGSSRAMYIRGSGNIIQFCDGDGTFRWENVGRNGTYYIYKGYGSGSGYKFQIDDGGNVSINNGAGVTTVNGNLYAPIVYDSNDSGYYVDPNSTSRLNTITANTITGNINSMPYDGNGISGMGIISNWDSRPTVGSAGYGINWHTGVTLSGYPGYGGVRLYSSGYPTHAGSVLRLEASYGVYTYGQFTNDSRVDAPIFYDSQDTGYYCNPNGVTNLGGVNDLPLRVTKTNGLNSACTTFQNTSGDNSWGIVSEFRVNGSPGTDRPSILFSQGYDSNTWALGFGYADSGYFRINRDHGFRNGSWGTTLMQMDRSGNVTFTGNVTAYSDERIKTNIKKIDNALGIVRQLEGVTFNYIEDGRHGLGVIAQNVEKVLPMLVSEMPSSNGQTYKNVAYGNMVGVLIEAIKEQDVEVTELKQQIEKQQSELEELKSLVKSLLANR